MSACLPFFTAEHWTTDRAKGREGPPSGSAGFGASQPIFIEP